MDTKKKNARYHQYYPGRNKVIKEYSHSKDKYAWASEEEEELLYSNVNKDKGTKKPKKVV